MVIIRGILQGAWIFTTIAPPIYPSLDKKKPELCSFLKMDLKIKSPIFLLGTFLIKLFFTPNIDILIFGLSKHRALGLWTGNTLIYGCDYSGYYMYVKLLLVLRWLHCVSPGFGPWISHERFAWRADVQRGKTEKTNSSKQKWFD